MSIEPDKQYQTKGGLPAVIYAVYGSENVHGGAVHGAFKRQDGQWVSYTWNLQGRAFPSCSWDLVEVKPRIKRTVWLNIYSYDTAAHRSKESAETAGAANGERIACIKVEIDAHEGDGL